MDGAMCQLCQETIRLFMLIQEKLQKEHTISTTHFPITEEETELCTVNSSLMFSSISVGRPQQVMKTSTVEFAGNKRIKF